MARYKSSCSLTDAQLEQLLCYAEWAEADGDYYGSKDQFDKRHAAIMAWIRGEMASREGRERKRLEERLEGEGDRDSANEIPN